MRRTGWQFSWLALSLLACGGTVRIGQGETDAGVGVGGTANGVGGTVNGVAGTTNATAGTPFVATGGTDHSGNDGSLDHVGGSAGSGGTTAVKIPWPPITRTKIDLLFMIDNSTSMADKQEILANGLPALVDRLISPLCLDTVNHQVTGSSVKGVCPQGSEAEFGPPLDIHVGLIDSSLGAYGVSGICQDTDTSSHNNDKAELLTRGTSSLSAPFLSWISGTNSSSMTAQLQSMVKEVGQHGCGYEAQLESVYRFLVDPDPPAEVSLTEDDRGTKVIAPSGTDQLLLAERAAFLRPDSLVLIILLSDEDDCSLQEAGQAWLAFAPADQTQHGLLRPGTDPCNTNPNDPCCFNCAQDPSPAGCPAASSYSNCVRDGESAFFKAEEDPANLRCWDQKRRYGIDFLYPVQRYIDGFQQPTVERNGKLVDNPLFSDLSCPPGTAGCTTAPPRDPGSILFTAIVGVPWQDLASDSQDPGAGYRTGASLERTWGRVLGDPHASPPVPPSDPFMIASVQPRKLFEPPSPWAPTALSGEPPTTNPINGLEWDTSKTYPQANADLQYACIFPLPTPRDCSAQTTDCDCVDYTEKGGFAPKDYKSPLCQDDSGTFGTTQYHAKAYPGLRELEVVKGLGSQGIAASVCAALTTGPSSNADYGYNPVMTTVLSTIRPHLPTP